MRGKHPVFGAEPWFWITDMFSTVGPGCHQNPRKFVSGMDIRILDIGLEIAEAYGKTNGSSQGMEPQDDPLVPDRFFQQDLPPLKDEKCRVPTLPTCQAMKKDTKNDSPRFVSD